MKTPFLFLALLVGFSAMLNAQPAKSSGGLRIELDMFSGRPNPVFTVTDPAQVEEILAFANSLPLPTKVQSTPNAPSLGYRGIIVTRLSADASDVQGINVFRSAVQIKRKPAAAPADTGAAATDTADLRFDTSSTLETRLLNLALARGVIDQHLLGFINAK